MTDPVPATTNPPRTIFVSYSHDSDSHRQRVLGLSERLRQDGIETHLDQYISGTPAEGWPRWMLNQFDWATCVLVICTETYYRRFRGREEGDKGKGADWEGQLITLALYRAKSATVKFVPVIFEPADQEFIPEPLQGHSFYLLNSDPNYQKLLDSLLDQDGIEPGKVGRPKRNPRKKGTPLTFDDAGDERVETAVPDVSIAKLPRTGEHFLGRDDELTSLDGAWAGDDIDVLSIVAWGGVGKSALVNEWLGRMSRDHWRGAERVFAWTFYSQGTRDTAASADQFIGEALKWFDDPDPTAGSAWDKGERLARLVRGRRTLLLLDGLEPLQEPPHAAEPGRITDPALATLVRELALENPGLCLITTREPVADLAGARHATTAQLDLAHLSTNAGVVLLGDLGVQGTDDERRQLVQDVRGHALTLTLLGKYLAQAHGGDIRKRNEVKFVEADAEVQGGHAFRVMEAYERWFVPRENLFRLLLSLFSRKKREARQEGKRLTAILRLLGFFDRPAEAGCLAALRKQPPIPDLTEPLVDLSEAQWSLAISRLTASGLVTAPSSFSSSSPTTNNQQPTTLLDSHPLVREHFGEQVRTRFPAAWKEGHSRLYEHLKQAAPDLPETLEEMMPLFAAVAHGCLAGRHQEACNDVYWRRIQRGAESFNTHKLGAIGAEVAALSGFFAHLWDKPEPSLTEAAQAWLLNEAGFDLRALGRLAQAFQPMQAGLAPDLDKKNWKGAAISAGNLSELSLTLGRVEESQRYGQQSVELADRSGKDDWQNFITSRTTLADALHQEGRLEEAQEAFREAEAMQKERQPQYPLLYSLRGYRYCDLLLSRAGFGLWLLDGRRSAGSDVRWTISARNADAAATATTLDEAIELCREVQKRAGQTLQWEEGRLLDIALDHLSLGRALLLEHCLTGETSKLGPATEHLNAAVDGLRKAGQQWMLPGGLLARTALRRVTGDASGAAHDLAEVQESAERSGMRLFQVDALIEEACQQMAKAEAGSTSNETTPPTPDWKPKARECVAKAKALIEETGYHRRDPEIAYLEQILS